MDKVEQIKNWIEGELKNIKALKAFNNLTEYGTGAGDYLANLYSFINSLENESVSDDLEEEIKRYIPRDKCPIPDFMEAIARHFAEWQYQKDRLGFSKLKAKEWTDGFHAGIEKMMNDAVVGTITTQNFNRYILVPMLDESLKYGDKVKLIILKEDE